MTDLPIVTEDIEAEKIIELMSNLLNSSKVHFNDRVRSRLLRFFGFKASQGVEGIPSIKYSLTQLFEPSTESYNSDRIVCDNVQV